MICRKACQFILGMFRFVFVYESSLRVGMNIIWACLGLMMPMDPLTPLSIPTKTVSEYWSKFSLAGVGLALIVSFCIAFMFYFVL